MGLDMYLIKETYIGASREYNDAQVEISVKRQGKDVYINSNRITYIHEEVAYWRKANQIHNWFVEIVQNGIDDCRSYPVSLSQLRELNDLCIQVLEKKDNHFSEHCLPTRDGCFFGDTGYEELYYADVEDTINMLTTLIEETNDNYVTFQYRSSW